MRAYQHQEVESEVTAYWNDRKVYAHITERNRKNAPFVFIDGPPYTSGKVHIGTALNKILKDMVLRYKRMHGFAVYDRAGYDMHGLPTEQPTMKKLGLNTSEDIENYGVDKFIEACREWCVTNMHAMTEDFKKLGVWMDFENAYQPISKEFTDGAWFLIKRAHEKERLYQGLRTLAWDPVFQTACAKHELDYKEVTDQSIYVKLRVLQNGKPSNRFLVIWTTTPWTIPFNLAVMAHPDFEYAVCQVDDEEWIVAKGLADDAIKETAEKEYKIIETITGEKLSGTQYEHPLKEKIDYKKIKKEYPNTHTVILSRDYVDLSAGTGLVHCAPGCGPEDYEVGISYGLPAYNNISSDGRFPEPFDGWRARTDDKKFIEAIEESGALVCKKAYAHDYPHSERSGAPVIYRTTKQWFFKVSDMKEQLLEENEKVYWLPVSAKNAFSSWLSNLRDNSITKQRYWGTPVPIWLNEKTGEVLVVGSIKELEELSGKELDDPHRPYIDEIVIKSKLHPGTVLRRIPDVLDVWVDAGTASWNALGYPRDESLIDSHYPSQFIIEAKDQIRGWFNLMHICGFLAFDKPAFTTVYMHGFINDSKGRKMSKSLGNYITPDEILPKFGSDAFRLAMIKASTPGIDVSYSHEAIGSAYKNINVLWNTVQYLIDLCRTNEIVPREIDSGDEEELYMLSRMNSVTKEVNDLLEKYELSNAQAPIEEFWLELSRTYIQLTREKANADDRQLVADLLYTTLERALILIAPICPYTSEALWQELGVLVGRDDSVHEQNWPQPKDSQIDAPLENDFAILQDLITAGLSAREKLKQGVRWPLAKISVVTEHSSIEKYEPLLQRQLNVKKVVWNPKEFSEARRVDPNFATIAKTFGKETQKVASLIRELQPLPPVTIEGFALLPEHVKISAAEVAGSITSTFKGGVVYLDGEVTPELLEEGYMRELVRRIQQLRRDSGLEKRDEIELCIKGAEISEANRDEIARKTNAVLTDEAVDDEKEEVIRDRTYIVSLRKTI